jgi:hypothetical protein
LLKLCKPFWIDCKIKCFMRWQSFSIRTISEVEILTQATCLG